MLPDLVVVGGLLLGMIAVSLLGRRYPPVRRAVTAFFRGLVLGSAAVVAALIPVVGMAWLQLRVLPRLAFQVQLVVLVVWGALLTLGLFVIWTKGQRERLFEGLGRAGFLTPLVYSANLLIIAALFFSAVTFLLAERELVRFEPGADLSDVGAIIGLYLWHFLDAIPLLEVPATLSWSQPLAYDDARVGLLVLLFKVVVILPVIAAFTGYWAWRRAGVGVGEG